MAQFIKIFAGSKLLLLPASALGVVGVGAFVVSFSVARWTSGRLLGVELENPSTFCTTAAYSTGALSVGGYLSYRHKFYNPPNFNQLFAALSAAAMTPPPTNVAGLPLDPGPITASPNQSTTLPHNTFVSNSSTGIGTNPSSLPYTSRYTAIMNVLRPPLKFYAINTFVGAAVLGVGMSIGQRLICGKANPKQIEKKQH